MALKVGELFASFNLDTSGIDGAISGAEKKLSSLGKGMAIGGAAMSAAVTAPIVGAFKDIYSKGSEFNSQMSKVFAIRGLNSTLSADVEAMDQLNAKALEMGSTTKFTASEAGQAFEYMAMAGWDTASMLGGIEPILNLAAAAGEDLGTTSDIVTDAMTAFGYTIDKVGGDTQKFTEMTTHFTDVLAAVSSNANTNVSMLGESFKYVGPIAGSLGYSIEDTAVALGIMANSGIKSSQAGTSLRTIMTRLNGDIKISGKNMKEVTVRTANADGSMRDFSEIIADCREAFKGLTESEKAQVAESLVGRNAMSGFLTLMNATDDEIASLTGAINNCNGATKRMADMMLDNVGGSVTLFKSAVEGLEITLWELVKGPVKDLIDRATGVVDAFRNMDSATQMGTLKMAGFAAAIGPVLTASGGLLMALPKIAKGVAALASPLGVVGIGLLAFTAAAMDSNNQIGQTFEKMGKGVKKTLTGVNKQLDKKFLSWNYKTGKSAIGSQMIAFSESITAGLKDIIPAGMETVSLFLRSLMKGISDSASSLAGIGKTVITELLNGITKGLPKLVPLAAEMISNIAAALISNTPEILSAGITLFTTLIESLNKVNWAQIGTKINEAVKTALSDIKTNLFTLVFGEEPKGEDLGDWGKFGSKVVEKIKDGIKAALSSARDFFGSLLLGENYNPGEDWATFGAKIIDKIFEGADGAASGASEFVGGILTGIGNMFTDDAMSKASGTLSTIAGTLIDHIFAEIPKLAGRAGTLLEKLATLILGNESSNGLAANVLDGATQLVNAIFTAITAGMESGNGTSAAQKLLDVLGKAFSSENISRITTNLNGLIEAIFSGMTTVLPQFGAQAGNVIKGIIDLMFKKNENGTSLFGSALTSVQTLVSTLIRSIIDFVPQAASTATNLLSTLLDTLFAPQGEGGTEKSLVSGALESVKELVHTVLQSIPGLIQTMGGSAVSIITSIGQMLTQKDESGKYIASGIVDSLSELITQALQDVVALIPSLSGAITGIIGEIGKVLTAKDENDQYVASSISQSLVALVTNAVDTAISAIPSLSDAIGGIINAIGNVLTSQDSEGNYIITSIADSMFTLVKSAVESVSAAIPQLSGLIAGIIGKIGEILAEKDETTGKYKATGIIDSLSEMVANAIETVVNLIPSLSESINGIIGAIGDVLVSKDDEGNYLITSLSESLISLVTSAVTAAVAAIPSIADTITGIIGAIAGVLSEKDDAGNYKLTGIADSLTQMVRDAIDTVIALIPTLGSSAAQILTAIGTALFGAGDDEGAVSQGVAALTTIVQTVFDTIRDSVIPSMGNAVGGIISAIASFFTKENMSKLGDSVGNLGESIIKGIADTISTVVDALVGITDSGDLESIAEGCGAYFENIATSIVDGLIYAIPKLMDAGGKLLGSLAKLFSVENMSKWISGAGDLAKGILESIVTAFSGNAEGEGKADLASGFTGLVEGLVAGIVEAVGHLPELLEGALSVGAQVANAIMGSITSALKDMEASGIAASLGQAAVDLVKGLLSSVGDLSKNTDVQSFMQNLGEGLRSALGMLGDICGEIIGWIFSTEGLKSIYNAGVTVANLLKQGIDAGLDATLNFFEHMFERVLVNLGLVNADDLEAAKESGKLLADTITESAGSELADTTHGRTFIDLMNWGLMNGSENKDWVDTSAMQQALKKAYDSSEGDVEKFRDQFFDGFLEAMSNDRDFMKEVTGHDILSEWIGDVLESLGDEDADFTNWSDYLKYLVGKGELNASDFIPQDMDFWQAFYEAYANNDTTAMMNLLASQGKEMFSGAAEAAEEATQGTAKDAAQEAAEAAREALTGSYEQAAADAEDTITSTMEQAGVNGVRGFTTGTKETAGEAEGAALQVSDDVVQTFLLTMSQENGYLIGENFVLAMGAAMSDKTADMSAIALSAGQAAYNALNGSASYANGYTIGYNFGMGFVNGIEAMIDRAASAAASLGAAGTSSLSSIIQEGSPSRITGESGDNFGLGFINHILDSADGAADAAARMGRSAGEALAYTVRGIGAEAAEIPLPLRNGYGQMAASYQGGQQSDPAIEQMTNRIIEAMSHMGVYIDGEPAGHVLTPYISEEIAHNTSVRR